MLYAIEPLVIILRTQINALRTSRSKSYISHGSFRPGVMNHWIMYFESTPQPILQVTTPGICQFLIGNPHLKKNTFIYLPPGILPDLGGYI